MYYVYRRPWAYARRHVRYIRRVAPTGVGPVALFISWICSDMD